MEGSDSGEGSGSSSSNKSNAYAGMKRRHSGKVVKRSVIQPPKQQTPLYNIHKNDFRSIVQRLTGSPAAPPPPPPPPPPPQKSRPPESVYSFNELVSNPANLAAMKSASFPSYQQQAQLASPTATFAPFATAAGADSGFEFQFRSPQIYAPLVSHVTVPSAFSAPVHFPYPAMAAPQGGSSLFLQSSGGNSREFVSSGSQFHAVSHEFVSAGSQVPFSPGSFVALPPPEQFQIEQLPSSSAGSFFSLPATAHFPSSSF